MVVPNTSAIDRVIALLGRDRLLAEVTDAEIGQALFKKVIEHTITFAPHLLC
ncbi:hypothetical protein [Nonomuraea sp. 10N515B]|uniref:hypothetical protein n=1 Tax=Nonomuraea sp. 10N515B TaxID=3457422 RepID=UPI003FCEE252